MPSLRPALTRRQFFGLAALLALTVRVVAVLAYLPTFFINDDEPLFLQTAQTLVETGEYLTGGVGAPEIIRGPAYPGFLAALLWLQAGAGLLMPLLVHALLGGATVVIVSVTFGDLLRTARVLPDRVVTVERMVVIVLALSPFAILYERLLISEALATFLLALTVFFWARSPRSDLTQYGSLFHAILSGLFLGLLTLTKPVFTLFPLLLCASHLAGRRVGSGGRRHRLAVALAPIIGTLVVVAPWALRNYSISGRPTLVGLGGGVFLYMGTLPMTADGRPHLSNEDLMKITPWYDTETTVPERYRIDAALKEEAVERILARPGQYLSLCVTRVARLWITSHASAIFRDAERVPLNIRLVLAFASASLVLLAIVGAFAAYRSKFLKGLLPFIAIPIFLTFFHAPMASGGRYVIPGWPYLLSMACLGLMVVTSRFVDKAKGNEPPM